MSRSCHGLRPSPQLGGQPCLRTLQRRQEGVDDGRHLEALGAHRDAYPCHERAAAREHRRGLERTPISCSWSVVA
jgi:hypothetical protein